VDPIRIYFDEDSMHSDLVLALRYRDISFHAS